MDPQSEIDYIMEIFSKFRSQKDPYLLRGLKLRKKMQEDIKNGIMPSGYRIEWIRESADKIIGLLDVLVEEFGLEHQDDKASNLDVLDVLSTVMHLYEG